MSEKFAGKRVVVTAAGAGIGKVIAEAFLAVGARVHVCDIDSDALNELRVAAPGVAVTVADVADRMQVDRLFDEAEANLGGLDILVNNAGIAGPTGPIDAASPEEWTRTIDVNLIGHFHCLQRGVPLLKTAGGGAIVNMSSAAGVMGFPLRTPYAASKWAIVGLTKSLAIELGEFGIRVNAICPGAVEGPRIERVIAAEAQSRGLDSASLRERYLNMNSLHTFIGAADIANMTLFLCSDAGARISGQALRVDGDTLALKMTI
jgi:NAD(P)-dependent dehydrogenase (short-subunit alcohol dehydrogenase family)